MTSQWPGPSDATLRASPAAWISPESRLPVNDGRKVILNDTDHSFFWTGLRSAGPGRAAILGVGELHARQPMPVHGSLPRSEPRSGRNNPAGGKPDPYWETLRKAMGHTRTIATRMNLAAMVPHDDLARARFCLADPGREYLVYLPDGGETVIDLSAASGTFRVEWMDPTDGTTLMGDAVAGGARRSFKCACSRRCRPPYPRRAMRVLLVVLGDVFHFTPRMTRSRTPDDLQIRLRRLVIGRAVHRDRGRRARPGRSAG